MIREFFVTKLSSVVYGAGAVTELPRKVAEFGGTRVLIVTSASVKRSGLADRVAEILGSTCVGVYAGAVQHTPRECVIEGARLARDLGADMLVSIGGSSASDTAKVLNVVLTEGEDLDRLIVRFEPPDRTTVPPLDNPKLPLIAIPTTLSAGEFNYSAGVTDMQRHRKDSVRHDNLTPKTIILDPDMTVHTGRELWTGTAMKMLSDTFEEIWSPRRTPFVDALCLHAIRIIDEHLIRSIDVQELASRGLLLQAGWMTMFGRRAAGAGIIAALRHQIGAVYNVPHGVASSIVFPRCIAFNRPGVDDQLLLIADAFGIRDGDRERRIAGVIARTERLTAECGLPQRLRDVGVPKEDLRPIAEAAMHDHTLGNNPKRVGSADELVALLESVW